MKTQLSKKDFLDEGFIIQVSSWDRQTLKRMAMEYIPLPVFDGEGIHFEHVVNETLVHQFYWDGKDGLMIIKAFKDETLGFGVLDLSSGGKDFKPKKSNFMNFDCIFKGKIKDKAELKILLRQLEITSITYYKNRI